MNRNNILTTALLALALSSTSLAQSKGHENDTAVAAPELSPNAIGAGLTLITTVALLARRKPNSKG